MKITKNYTPGPWRAEESQYNWEVLDARGNILFAGQEPETDMDAFTDVADARLAAAAPQLVEALIKVLDDETLAGGSVEYSEVANAALAAAGILTEDK